MKIGVNCTILTYNSIYGVLVGNIEYKIKFCETIIEKNRTRVW